MLLLNVQLYGVHCSAKGNTAFTENQNWFWPSSHLGILLQWPLSYLQPRGRSLQAVCEHIFLWMQQNFILQGWAFIPTFRCVLDNAAGPELRHWKLVFRDGVGNDDSLPVTLAWFPSRQHVRLPLTPICMSRKQQGPPEARAGTLGQSPEDQWLASGASANAYSQHAGSRAGRWAQSKSPLWDPPMGKFQPGFCACIHDEGGSTRRGVSEENNGPPSPSDFNHASVLQWLTLCDTTSCWCQSDCSSIRKGSRWRHYGDLFPSICYAAAAALQNVSIVAWGLSHMSCVISVWVKHHAREQPVSLSK